MKLSEKIQAVLQDKVSPGIMAHGGRVRFVDVQDGTVYVELSGACAGCPGADQATRGWILDVLQAEFSEVSQVELVQRIDPELLAFARDRLRRLRTSAS